ncbi:MAG: nucleoside recognition domain-containing protein [Gemmatimonadota bacterium]|jgi:spore maturation protein A
MLNYIWSALIVLSLVFALWTDLGDLAADRYRNGQALPVAVVVPNDYEPDTRAVPVTIEIDPAGYRTFYGTDSVPPQATYEGTLVQTAEGRQLRFTNTDALPEPLATIQTVSQSNDGELQGTLASFGPPTGSTTLPATVRFERVRFVKMNAISQAALDFATTAAEIALGLIGVLALFLGLLKIGEEAGIIHALVRLVRPVLKPLFPEIPDDHPALGMIALNLTANVFGLGNAATPFGIKAMEELQELNPTDDTATNSMVMLLAINTASVQIMPPVLLLALLGLEINQLVFAIIITTGLSLVIAIAAVKLYGRLPGTRASDPNRLLTDPPAPAGTAE